MIEGVAGVGSESTPRFDGSIVDLTFPIQGKSIPADHGSALYAAISRRIPSFHGDKAVGIHPIRGRVIGGRQLAMTPQSRLILRLPLARITDALPLIGELLEIEGTSILLGAPTTRQFVPRSSLASRLVVIRGFTESGAFLEAVGRQLEALELHGTASLLYRRKDSAMEGGIGSRDIAVKRTLRIHDREIVGFAVCVDHLTAEESIQLQEIGLGGRRHFGCGIFVPAARGKA